MIFLLNKLMYYLPYNKCINEVFVHTAEYPTNFIINIPDDIFIQKIFNLLNIQSILNFCNTSKNYYNFLTENLWKKLYVGRYGCCYECDCQPINTYKYTYQCCYEMEKID
jgi:hypothetical protein